MASIVLCVVCLTSQERVSKLLKRKKLCFPAERSNVDTYCIVRHNIMMKLLCLVITFLRRLY